MKERILYIDYLKCLLIFLVVWGHATQYWGDNSVINNTIDFHMILPFHMPLFAVISGFFFKVNQGLADCIVKKSKQLVWPLFFWSFVIFGIIDSCKKGYLYFQGGDSLHAFATIRNIYYNVIEWGWWFLRSLFLCFALASITVNVSRRKPYLALSVSVVMFYALAWSGIIPNMDIKLNGFFFLYPFFCLGVFLKRYNKVITERKWVVLIASFVAFVVSLCYWEGWNNTFYQMNTSLVATTGYHDIVGIEVFRLSVIRLLAGSSASIFFLVLFQIIFQQASSDSYISRILSQIGQNTLGIYILHSFFLDVFVKKVNISETQFLSVLLCFFLSILIVIVFNRIYIITQKSRICSMLMWGRG